MSERDVLLVWAQARGGVIGKDNAIPWHIPEDMAHFKEVTRGLPVAMGRRTWESLPPRFRPLPGRRNIVVTSGTEPLTGAEIAHSVADALAATGGDICVIGGAQIYTAAMPFASALIVTEIDLDVDGDTYAPTIGTVWAPISNTDWLTSPASGARYRFVRYERA